MATISFSVNFTLPPHDTLTSQCVVFYVGAYRERDCYHTYHSVNAVTSWSVFCNQYPTGTTQVFSGNITTDTEIDSQCRIRLQVYAIPCCFLAEPSGNTITCGAVSYPPTPASLLSNPGLSSYTHIIDPNNTYSNCRRYTIGNNNIPVTITQITVNPCYPPDVYYCDPTNYPHTTAPQTTLIPPLLQNSLLNTPVPNGTNINNCNYSNIELDTLPVGQSYFPPYGVIKFCGDVNNPPVLFNDSSGAPIILTPGTDYTQMINPNVSCDECCHRCKTYSVGLTLDSGCAGEQYFAFQNCRENNRLTILPILPGRIITVCAVEGTITFLTPCLSNNGYVTYTGLCDYPGVPTP